MNRLPELAGLKQLFILQLLNPESNDDGMIGERV